jgi:hypothetical protein
MASASLFDPELPQTLLHFCAEQTLQVTGGEPSSWVYIRGCGRVKKNRVRNRWMSRKNCEATLPASLKKLAPI